MMLKQEAKLRYREELEAQIAAKNIYTPHISETNTSSSSVKSSLDKQLQARRQANLNIANELLVSQSEKFNKLRALKEKELQEDRQRIATIERRRQADLQLQKNHKNYLQRVAEQNMKQAELRKEIEHLQKAKEKAEDKYMLEAKQRLQEERRRLYEHNVYDHYDTRSKSTSPTIKPKDREAERTRLQDSFANYSDPNRIPEHLVRKLVYRSAAEEMRLGLERQLQEKREQDLNKLRENSLERSRLQREEELFKERVRQQKIEKLRAQRELYESLAAAR
mmetsp:Transcript_19234/g.35287  ORF Transcript_19234/g.35287 Transcript_19234/m.35287 type:complete len:279 (+) Transcript_19234:4390-5226(+)